MEKGKQIKRSFLTSEVDMTSGNLFGKMILYALPILLTTVLQLLYSTVDLISVQKWGGGDTSMGSIAANGALINLIIVVFNNISLGANVCIANAKGAGDREKANKILHTSMLFSITSGFFVGFVGFALSDNFLRLMGTEEAYLDLATLYLKIYFVGLPFLMIYNYASQNLRAVGDSKSPFIILLISGIINVIVDFIFVKYLKLDVAGVAWATVISEGISSILSIIYLFSNKKGYIYLKINELKIDKKVLKEIVKVGLPAGFQGFFFSLPNVFIQASLYTIDPGNINLSNGAIASGQIESYIYAGINAISVTTMSFISSNMGAKLTNNMKKVFLYSMIINFIYYGIVCIIVITLNHQILSLFLSSDVAIKYGRQRLFLLAFTYFFDGLMDISGSSLRGVKYSTYPMITTLIFCTGLRILFVETLFKVDMFHTLTWLYMIMPISWILSTICNFIGRATIIPKIYKNIESTKGNNTLATA